MDTGNIITTQISATAIFVWGFQQLKRASWFPVLKERGQKIVQRSISVVAALFIHGGITYAWNPTVDANGLRHLDLAIPSFMVFCIGIWHWLTQFVFQESWFQAAYNRFNLSSLPSDVVAKDVPAPISQQKSPDALTGVK